MKFQVRSFFHPRFRKLPKQNIPPLFHLLPGDIALVPADGFGILLLFVCPCLLPSAPARGSWRAEQTDRHTEGSVTAPSSARTRRTTQDVCTSPFSENLPLNHSFSGNRTRCLRSPARPGGLPDFFFISECNFCQFYISC